MRLHSLIGAILMGIIATQAGAQKIEKAPAAAKPNAATTSATMPIWEWRELQEDPANQAEGILWPGESTTFHGITMTWKVLNAYKTTSAPLGFILLKGPRTELPPVNLLSPEARNHQRDQLCAYLDDAMVHFSYEVINKPDGPVKTAATIPQGIHFEFRAQPANFITNADSINQRVFISSPNPLRLGSMKISLSERPVAYPDGTNHLQLQILDAEGGTSVTIPAVLGSARQVGRFKLQVIGFFDETQTAQVAINAEADPRPLGGDSFGYIQVNMHETYEDLLSSLAEKYKFSVEWVAFPAGHPESIDYAKNLEPSTDPIPSGRSNHIISAILNQINNNTSTNNYKQALTLEWTDPRHLRVWAKNYDKVLAEKERTQKEEADKAAELKMMKDLFAHSYTADTKIMPLKKLSAVTARALVEPEMMDYFLVQLVPSQLAYQFIETVRQYTLKEGKYYSILGVSQGKPDQLALLKSIFLAPQILDSSKDTVTADERANALILRVAPATKKVYAILEAMENMMAAPKAAESIEQYRIEVILLAGVKEAAADEKAAFDPEKPVIQYDGKDFVFEKVKFNSDYSPDHSKDVIILYKAKDATTTIPQSVPLPATLDLKGKKVTVVRIQPHPKEPNLIDVQYLVEDQAAEAPKSAQDYGISPEDLKVMGFDKVRELGRGVVSLAGRKDELGKATLSLGDSYRCQIEYQDMQKPYLIVRGSLLGDKADKQLIGNTLFMEKDKPVLLGLTNLKEALILLVKQTK